MDERQRQSVTISAKTVNEAIAEAEQKLGLSRDELDITVISEGSRGFLGMGAENARILAVPKAVLTGGMPLAPAAPPSTPSPAPARRAPTSSASAVSPTPSRQRAPSGEDEEDETAASLRGEFDAEMDLAAEAAEQPSEAVQAARTADVAAEAAQVLRDMLERMGIEATVKVRSTGQPVTLDVSGENLGLLIGRHGDTLTSLQYLLNVIVGRRTRHWSKIVVDVEGYRARREDALRSLAERQADRVRRSQREVTLDYMPARERRIVHLTLQDSVDVITHSVGDEPYRRVVIAPKKP